VVSKIQESRQALPYDEGTLVLFRLKLQTW
jgi:hypothetical protein